MSNEIKGIGNSYTAEFWEYDPRLGRRWNLDPRPNVSISPYATLSNNPIWFNDIKGDTTYKFNTGGIFLGMDDLDVTGVVGSIGNYKARRDANGKKFQSWESSVNFTFNDLSIDREQLNSLEVGQKGITIVSDENINWVMSKSDIKRKSMLSRWYFAASESVTEKMDFNLSYTLPSQGVEPQGGGDVKSVEGFGGFMLFGNHHTAFNLNDAGQFLWGQAMNRLGFDYSNAKIGSQSFARTFEFAWDTSADQKAIREGFHYRPKLQTAASAGPFEGLPKQEWRRSNKDEKKTKNN